MSSGTPPQTVEELVERTRRTRGELQQRWLRIEEEATRIALERDRGRYQARSALGRVAVALLLMALGGVVVALVPDESVTRLAGAGVTLVALYAGLSAARLAAALRSTVISDERKVAGVEPEPR